jgi:hypothetical protein
MKSIKELTDKEAEEMLKFVYPDRDYWFDKVHLESKIEEDGSRQVTFGMRPIIGISYMAGVNHDRCMLHFDDTRAILWLYKNGYDIEEQLTMNKDFSRIEMDLENLAYEIHWTCDHAPNSMKEKGAKEAFTLEKTRERLLEAANKYYYDTDY